MKRMPRLRLLTAAEFPEALLVHVQTSLLYFVPAAHAMKSPPCFRRNPKGLVGSGLNGHSEIV